MVVVLVGLNAVSVPAEEPINAFLTELQDRGLFDVALRHVERMAKSPLSSTTFKQEADYRRGSLLVNYARTTKNSEQKRQTLDQAKQAFERFLSQHSGHPSASLARSQLGNILVERARQLMAKAKADPTNRSALLKQAAGFYSKAYKSLSKSREELKSQYASYAGRRDEESQRRLKELQPKYVQTYLAIARVLFEQAKTVEQDPKRYRAKLTEAAKEFGDIVDKYRKYSASILALRYQGECYQLMDEHKQALSYFKELLQNEDTSGAVRRIKTQAISMSIESWLATEGAKGAERSISVATSWMNKLRESEQRDSAVQELRLATARAYLEKAKNAKNDKEAERARKEARELANTVARQRGPIQTEAQRFLVAMGAGTQTKEAALIDNSDTVSANFEEARTAATKSLDELKRVKITIKILTGQLSDVRDPGRRAEIESRVSVEQEKSDELTKQTLELYERADRLATPEDVDAINGVRYYMAFLNYSLQNYRRAAVLGSFVAFHYPDSIAAKDCASVALASRQRLFQTAKDSDRELQATAIGKLAELMSDKWPGQQTAQSAMMTQLDLIVSRGDMAKAQAFLEKFPSDSPQRAKAELRIGQAIWREYLRRLASGSKEDGNSGNELVELKTRAKAILASGVNRVSSEAPDESTIRAALSLAQIYVDSGEPQKSLELMNHEGFGALKLIEERSPWTRKIPPLTTEAYKTAIRAHVASAANSGDSGASIDAAQDMLEALRSEFRNQPNGRKKLIPIYISLAKDLERQLKIAAPADRRALSRGFESFLQSASEGNKDVAVQNWVGATFFSLGQGMLQGNKTSPEAQRYFTKSAKAYEQVLMMAGKQPNALSATALMQVQARQAMALRQLGKYDQAMDLFEELLSGQKKSFLNIQVEAAKTLQQWGESGRNAQAFDKAIAGDRAGKDGRNVIWGWGRIAKVVSKNEKYRDMFHDARYNIADCRYRAGMKQAGAKKSALLKRAKTDITMTKQLFNLGTKQQTQRYERLLKQIQGALGEQPIGFAKQS